MELAKFKLAKEQGQSGGVQYSRHTKGGNLKAVVRGGRILVKDIGAQVLKKFLDLAGLLIAKLKMLDCFVDDIFPSNFQSVLLVHKLVRLNLTNLPTSRNSSSLG